MIKYKLTTQECTTKNGTVWEIGKTNRAVGAGDELCTSGVLHYYDGPLTAVLLNPIHAEIENPRLFAIECDSVAHDGVKGGSKWQRPVRELDVPTPSATTRVAFGILCALEVCSDPGFVKWARAWLSGADRTWKSAYNAYNAYSAAHAAVRAAHSAAHAAVRAAHNAAYAAYAVVAYAVATDAAHAAVLAAPRTLNLEDLAEQAFQCRSLEH